MDLSDLFDFGRNLYAVYSFSKKTGAVKMPLRYILELTYRCNLRCPFCYIPDKTGGNELTTVEWLDIINQIPPFAIISFVAGEVLLKEDFIKIYEKASEKFRKVTVISNGIKLNSEIIDSFIKNNLFLLSVSLDGYGEKHDEMRNCKGLWNTVITNLELFNLKKENKKKTQGLGKKLMLDIKTCVLENNLDELPVLYKEAMRLNAQFFSLTFIRKQRLRQNSRLWDEFTEEFYKKQYPAELYFDMKHFKEIYKELESLSKKSKTILRYAPRFKARGGIEKIERFFYGKDKPVSEIYKPCRIPFTSIYITPQGFVYPCLSYKTADLKELTLKEAVNTTKFKCFRKNLYAGKIFNACQMCCDAIPQ